MPTACELWICLTFFQVLSLHSAPRSTFPFCLFHCLCLPLWTPKWMPNPSSLILSTPKSYKKAACSFEQAAFLVRPMRFERTAFGVGVQRSIQLSYGRGYEKYYTISIAVCKASCPVFFFFDRFLYRSSSEKIQPQYFCIYSPNSRALSCPSRKRGEKSRCR